MIQSIIQIGNSQGVIIPSNILKSMGLRAGTKISIDVDVDEKRITLSAPGADPISSITPEFRQWLTDFKKKNYKMLKELAKTP